MAPEVSAGMSLKESSDELNPTVVTGDVVRSRASHSTSDYLALAIATCGVGYSPIAPGTFGSLVGIGFFVLIRSLILSLLWPLAARNRLNLLHISYGLIAIELLVVTVVAFAGTWAASRTERLQGVKDPGKVVIDEVAGQFIALIAVPLEATLWWTMIVGFLLFRFFDIVKPYPAGRLESLHGGLGIMADDIVAGAYAAVGVAALVSMVWFI